MSSIRKLAPARTLPPVVSSGHVSIVRVGDHVEIMVGRQRVILDGAEAMALGTLILETGAHAVRYPDRLYQPEKKS